MESLEMITSSLTYIVRKLFSNIRAYTYKDNKKQNNNN